METNLKIKALELLLGGAMLVASLLLVFVVIPMETTVSDMETTMQPSVFPTIAAFIVGVTSAVLIVQVLTGKMKPEHMGDGNTNMSRFCIALIGVLAYILLIQYVGFYSITLICLVAMQRFYAHSKWITSITVNVIFLIVVYLLFEIALQIPMPYGILI